MKKINLQLVLLFSVLVLLVACGSADKGNTGGSEVAKESNEPGEKTEDLLAKVQDEGKLVIGTEGTYPPFSFHDDKGELTGFDVEIAREIAKRLGVEPEFFETQWDAIFAGLDSKRFDMIANQVGINEDRVAKYDFSEHYITSSAVLITNAGNKEVKAFEDIKGLKSAQSLTSNYAETAKSYDAEIVGVEGFNQAIELINSKRVDVTINDKLSFLDFKKHKPDAPVQIVATADDVAQSGLMFRKGNETLVNAVNQALNEMIEDGTYLKISEKWFGEDVLN